CRCPRDRIEAYLARLSGPVLDRIDIQLRLPPVAVSDLSGSSEGERSAAVRERVVKARAIQLERQRSGIVRSACNTSIGSGGLATAASLDQSGQALIVSASEKLGLSARAYTKVLRVARTIADLEGVDAVRAVHVAEAVQLRLPTVRTQAVRAMEAPS